MIKRIFNLKLLRFYSSLQYGYFSAFQNIINKFYLSTLVKKNFYNTHNNHYNKEEKKYYQEKNKREKREEFYKIFGVVFGFGMFGLGLYQHIKSLQERRDERRAHLGRSLVHEIENRKFALRQCRIKVSGSEIVASSTLEEVEEKFGFILRYISAYDTTVIPELLKLEAEYQLQKLRKISEKLISSPEEASTLREALNRCLTDIYEVANIATVVAIASTVPETSRSPDEKIVFDAFYGQHPAATIEEVRNLYSDRQVSRFKDLKKKKLLFWGSQSNTDLRKREVMREELTFEHEPKGKTV